MLNMLWQSKMHRPDIDAFYIHKGQALETCFNHANIVTNLIRYEEQYPAFGDSREAKLIKVFILCQSKKRQCSRKSSPTNNLLFVIILTEEKFADC